jgi:DNA invertase Pin-like site-specific DNA recombinase/predicted DNA-binding transcriptional regulator AlpA
MTDLKVKPEHLRRGAFVYVRQSTTTQVEQHRESTQRQYALVERAHTLGWTPEQIIVIDDDLGLSGATTQGRSGFARMTAEVALGHVGIVLGLEVSRLARNNADWYRLLDLCGMTDTLIGDADGVYHPSLFNDRLVLGLKGTMSEAELHILRARLDGGIRNKAARGELRRGLPVGFVWGEDDGEIRFHPDEAVTRTIRTVFERFTELGSVRRVWLWFLSENLTFPLRVHSGADIRWIPPTYVTIHQVLTNPVYAGAYAYGKSRQERYVDETGMPRKRVRQLPRSQWAVLIPEHHEGFVDWDTYEANLARIASNTRPRPHQSGGAVREGTALLQGIAVCGHCGRRLRTHYQGRNASPGYHCPGKDIVHGRGVYCLNIGGMQIDHAVARAVIDALQPAGLEAALLAAEQVESNYDAALKQWQLAVERAHYEAKRAERRYRAVEPENRLVARGLETEWEQRLRELKQAESELHRREQRRPRELSPDERDAVLGLGENLQRVWHAPSTTARDQKELLRALLEEVIIADHRDEYRAHLTLRWRGGALTELDVHRPRSRPAPIRTDEDTVDLVRRLALHYPDAVIAGILNRQGKSTAYGHRFTANRVGNLRRHWNIPRFEPTNQPTEGEWVNIKQAANILGIAPSTIHRWLNDGFIAGEQLTPGAPWRIRLTDHLRSRFVEEPPEGYVPMQDATKILGVSRQTVLQRVKRGELDAVHVYRGKRKGLRIKAIDDYPDLFHHSS